MPLVTFTKRIPLTWETPAEEMMWYQNNAKIDGRPLTRRGLADMLKVTYSTVRNWAASYKDRGERRRSGKIIYDPPAPIMRLVRVELGLEKAYCEER